MTIERICEKFENGLIIGLKGQISTKSIEWSKHPVFEGVYLKHLIKGAETDGTLSCHLVKVNPGCVLDTHAHAGKLEIHEIIGGSGSCVIGEGSVEYQPGSVALIPADTIHEVQAGEDGLFILAKFCPALL